MISNGINWIVIGASVAYMIWRSTLCEYGKKFCYRWCDVSCGLHRFHADE